MAGNRKQRLLQLISEEGSWGRRLRSQKLAFDRYLRSFVQRMSLGTQLLAPHGHDNSNP